MIRVEPHAADALAIFYPRVTDDDVRFEVEAGVEIPPDTAIGLLGRRGRKPGGRSRYVLHRERTGLFVLVGDNRVVTFVRFYAKSQHDLASRLWPGGDPPSCNARWNVPVHREPTPREQAHEQKTRAKQAAHEAHQARQQAESLAAKERRKERKRLERHRAGLEQAATLLRANGWTCTPPEGA